MQLLLNTTSPYARIARIALAEKGYADIGTTVVDPWADAPALLEANAAARVPALLTDAGRPLTESLLIVLWLESQQPAALLARRQPDRHDLAGRHRDGRDRCGRHSLIGRESTPTRARRIACGLAGGADRPGPVGLEAVRPATSSGHAGPVGHRQRRRAGLRALPLSEGGVGVTGAAAAHRPRRAHEFRARPSRSACLAPDPQHNLVLEFAMTTPLADSAQVTTEFKRAMSPARVHRDDHQHHRRRRQPLRHDRHGSELADDGSTVAADLRQPQREHPFGPDRTGRFCVNVLTTEHEDLVSAFSGRLKGDARFEVGEWRSEDSGMPYLEGAQCNLFCDIDSVVPFGTHSVVIGRVSAVRVEEGIRPLIFADGKLGATQSLTGHVRIASNLSTLTQFLPTDLEAFLKKHPLIDVHLRKR